MAIKLLTVGKTGLSGGRKPCPAQAHCFQSFSTSSSLSPLDPLSGDSDKPVITSERPSAYSETTSLHGFQAARERARTNPGDPMSSSLVQFPTIRPFRSQIVKNTPDAVPPTEELEALETDLIELRQLTWERAKKADDDLRTIEESMRRLKEKEKGKAKLVEKMKRECALSF